MMKKIARLLSIAAASLLLTPCAYASNDDLYNFRFSPIGLIVGSVDANLDIKIDPNWTIGPQLGFWHHRFGSDYGFTSDFTVDAFEVGARANWFLNGAYVNSFFIGPALNYAHVKVTTTDSNHTPVSASISTVVASCLFGYAWFWDSFNIMLGGGGQFGLGKNAVELTNADGSKTSTNTRVAGLSAEFSLGWTF